MLSSVCESLLLSSVYSVLYISRYFTSLLNCLHDLINRSELIAEKKVLAPSDESPDLQEAMRSIMKQLVKCAVSPSPIRRHSSVTELERGLSVLYHVITIRQAEDKLGIADKQGNTLTVQLYIILNNHLTL